MRPQQSKCVGFLPAHLLCLLLPSLWTVHRGLAQPLSGVIYFAQGVSINLARMAERSVWELARALLWAVVVGVAVAVMQVLAGEEEPLRIMVPALLVFVVVALLLELWPRYQWGSRIRNAFSSVAARSPIAIRIERRTRSASLEGERGLWDFKRDGDRAMQEVTVVMGEMTRAMQRATKKTHRNARRFVKATARGVDMEKAYSLGEKSAKDINAHAAKMEKLEARFRKARTTMLENYTSWRQGQPSDADLGSWTAALAATAESAREAREGSESYRDSVMALRKQNVSRPINQATDRLVATLKRLIENILALENFSREAES